MARKKAFYRIGQDKAATTSIADLVFHNSKSFEKAGYFAPIRNTIGLTDHLVKKHQLSELDIFDPHIFFDREPKFKGGRKQFNKLMFETDLKDKNLFFTTETLWGRLSRKNLADEPLRRQVQKLLEAKAEYFKHHDLKIILHLRRADRYFESLYNHRIKAGFFDTTADFFTKPLVQKLPVQSLDLLDLLEAQFGRENIIIKPFERGQMFKNDVVADMLETLGISSFSSSFKVSLGNEALHRALAHALFKLNAKHGKLLTNRQLHEISNFIRQHTDLADEKRTMSKEQRLDILASFGDFYREVSRRYFDNAPLFHEEIENDQHLSYALDDATSDWLCEMVLHCKQNHIAYEQIGSALKKWMIKNPAPELS